MEVANLVYLIVKRGLKDVDGVNVYFAYDVKGDTLWRGDSVSIYSRGQSIDWLGVGASNYRVIENVTIDVKTKSWEKYRLLYEKITGLFDGHLFVFEGDDSAVSSLTENIDFDELKVFGAYVVGVRLIGDAGSYSFSEGDRIDLVDSFGNVAYSGYFFDIIDEWLFVILRKGVICLLRPVRVEEESYKLKKQYRFILDVEGTIVRCVET